VNWLDYTLIGLLAWCALRSAQKGFVREVIGLAAAVLALVLGMWFYGTAAEMVAPFTGPGRVANLVGFLMVVIAVLAAGGVAGWTVKRFIHAIGLSIVDRLLGAMFGVARGTLIATALLTAYMTFGPRGENAGARSGGAKEAPPAVVHSEIAPYLLEASRVFVSIAPMDFKLGFGERYEQVKAAAQEQLRGKDSGGKDSGGK